MTIPAYPLSWPEGWKRTAPVFRTHARFGSTREVRSTYSDNTWRQKGQITVAEAVSRIRGELQRMGIHDDDLVISTNLALRLDGLPRSGQGEPADPGAAVYWTMRDEAPRCMAIDRYDRVADNLAAIAATLNAMRAIERHGGAEILNRAFTGFVALEHQGDPPWWEVLDLDPSAKEPGITAAYRVMRSKHHPDRGGDPEQFQRVQRAYEQATAAHV